MYLQLILLFLLNSEKRQSAFLTSCSFSGQVAVWPVEEASFWTENYALSFCPMSRLQNRFPRSKVGGIHRWTPQIPTLLLESDTNLVCINWLPWSIGIGHNGFWFLFSHFIWWILVALSMHRLYLNNFSW